MPNISTEVIQVKQNSSFNPEMRHVTPSLSDPDDRSLDVPVDITGFSIKMSIKNIQSGNTLDTFDTTDSSITITNATGGYFKPLKTDLTGWETGLAEADIVLNDVNGNGLNDATVTFNIEVIPMVTVP